MSQIALVTGSSRGIGAAIAIELAKDGYDVIVHYKKSKEEAEKIARNIDSIGQKSYVIQGDVTKQSDVEKMFLEVSKFTKKLDLLVNNAGFDHGYMFDDFTIEQMREVLDSCLWSTILVTKIFLPIVKKAEKGQIVNISSRLGKEKTIKTASVYGAAKAGVIKLTQVLALEFSDYKIRVNCVAPGLTKTDLTDSTFLRDSGSKEEADKIWDNAAKSNPSGRVGIPQDIANTVSFLASSKAEYINGETIGVNGGSILV